MSTLDWCDSYAGLHWPDMRMGAMLNGTARRPFVGRSLVPALLKTFSSVGSPSAARAHRLFLENERTRHIIQGFESSHEIGTEARAATYLVMVWISLFSMGVGVAIFTRELGGSRCMSWMLGAGTVLLWPLLKCDERHIYFMYDPFTSTLVLWTFYALWRRAWAWAFVGYVACLLNRETALLIPFVALYDVLPGQGLKGKLTTWLSSFRAGTHSSWLPHVVGSGLAVLLGLGLRAALLRTVFRETVGEDLEYHFFDTTLVFDRAVRYLPTLTAIFGIYYFLVIRPWRSLHSLFQGAGLMFGVQLAAGAVVGVIDEIRQYGELFGVAAVIAGAVAMRSRPTPAAAPRTALRRHASLAASVAALSVIAYGCVRHWRDCLRAQAALERVDLAERRSLGQLAPDGAPWDAPGHYIFRKLEPTLFLLAPQRASGIDIGLDGNDEYRVTLQTDVKEAHYVVAPSGNLGITNHRLAAPRGLLREVRVMPIAGDGRYALGHLVVVP